MPDVDGRTLDRLAGRHVDDGQAQLERHARLALGDVSAELLVRHVVRPLGQLRREDAGDRAGGDGGGAGAGRLGRAGKERGSHEAAGGDERLPPRQLFVLVHVSKLSGRPK